MIYIVIYLFLEVMVSTTIASSIGGFLTFVEIIGTALIGTIMLKSFKYSLSSNIQDLTKGQITQEEFLKKNVGRALGALLLIVPGFFTDILGVMLQFGILTMMIGKIFSFKQKAATNSMNNQFYYESQFTQKNTGEKDDIIDVEVIDNSKSIKH